MQKRKWIFVLVLMEVVALSGLTGCAEKNEVMDSLLAQKLYGPETEDDIEEQTERLEYKETELEKEVEKYDCTEAEFKKKIVDIRDFTDLMPEELRGNLAQTILNLLHPEAEEITYDDEIMAYIVEEGKLEIGTSSNNDGYFVWLFAPVENFLIYGIEPEMTETDAVAVLEQQNILDNENGDYVINEEMYIHLNVEEGIVKQVVFTHYLAGQ